MEFVYGNNFYNLDEFKLILERILNIESLKKEDSQFIIFDFSFKD